MNSLHVYHVFKTLFCFVCAKVLPSGKEIIAGKDCFNGGKEQAKKVLTSLTDVCVRGGSGYPFTGLGWCVGVKDKSERPDPFLFVKEVRLSKKG